MPVSRKMLTKLFSATIEYIIPNKNDPSTFINNVENCGNEDTFISVFNKTLRLYLFHHQRKLVKLYYTFFCLRYSYPTIATELAKFILRELSSIGIVKRYFCSKIISCGNPTDSGPKTK